MKNSKKKKPLNKWKLTAIISLVINGIIALLLVVGLATPKTYAKTNAVGQYGDYYIYESSSRNHNFEFTDNEYESFSDLNTNSYYSVRRYISGSGYHAVDIEFQQYAFGESYLLDNDMPVIQTIALRFSPLSEEVSDLMYLSQVALLPRLSGSAYYVVILNEWNYHGVLDINTTYSNLGIDSPYALFPVSLPQVLIDHINKLFINRGTNEVIKDYHIEDNFNPNKYISVASDSQGLLFDSPTDYWNSDTRVTWSFPIYRGKTATSNPYDCSTLGFLELPFLFTSGGENFVSIRFYFDVVQQYINANNEVVDLSYGSSVVMHQYHYTFVYMSYCYQLATQTGTALTTWREKVVCAVPVQRMYVDYTEDNVNYRNFVYMPFQPLKWLNDSYKTIGVYQASTEQLAKVGINENVSRSRWAINQYTIEQILNYDMTQNASGINTGNNIGNVFILIKQAFDSLSGILSLAILPGISIGVLLFLPLVLTIIIVVIKLVKR